MLPLLFLDLDGVVNASYDSDQAMILPRCAAQLNRILKATRARVVISSAWRVWVHGRLMTLQGFSRMLRTHGIECQVVGVTPADGKVQGRGKQITAYLAEHPHVGRYVVLDDDEFDIRTEGHPLVRTDGGTGLTERDADLAIELLSPAPVAADGLTQQPKPRIGV